MTVYARFESVCLGVDTSLAATVLGGAALAFCTGGGFPGGRISLHLGFYIREK